MSSIQYQTIDGTPLDSEGFKEYFKEIIKLNAVNKDFNYPEFMYGLRKNCDMSMQDFMDLMAEINEDTLMPDEARIMNPFKRDGGKTPTLEELCEKCTPENRHEEIDFGGPMGKEII